MKNTCLFTITRISYKPVVVVAGLMGAIAHIQAAFDMLAQNRNYAEFFLVRAISIASWCAVAVVLLAAVNFALRFIGGIGVEYKIGDDELRITSIRYLGIAVAFGLLLVVSQYPIDILARDPHTWGTLIPFDFLAQDPANWGGFILFPFLVFTLSFLVICIALFVINTILYISGGVGLTYRNQELPPLLSKRKNTPQPFAEKSLSENPLVN